MAGEKILMHCCCGPCSSAGIERLAPDYDMTLFFYNPCIDDAAEYEKRKANLIRLVDTINANGYVGVPASDAADQNTDADDAEQNHDCDEVADQNHDSDATDQNPHIDVADDQSLHGDSVTDLNRPDNQNSHDAQKSDSAIPVTPLKYGPVKVIEGNYDPDNYLKAVKGLEGEPEGGARCAVCFRMRLMEAAKYAKEHGFDGFTTTLTVSPHKNYRVISEIGQEIAEEVGIEYYPFDFKKKDGFLHSIKLSKAYGLYRQDYCGCRFSKR